MQYKRIVWSLTGYPRLSCDCGDALCHHIELGRLLYLIVQSRMLIQFTPLVMICKQHS